MKSPNDTEIQGAIAIEIKHRRGKCRISQEELAHRAQVHRTFVAKIETAQTQPSLVVLFRLAAALETDFSELVIAIEKRYRCRVNQ